MELRLQVSDDVVRKFQDKLGSGVKMTDVARDALTLFNWAVDERAKGRLILSSNEEGENIIRLVMPSLENMNVIERAQAQNQQSKSQDRKHQPGVADVPGVVDEQSTAVTDTIQELSQDARRAEQDVRKAEAELARVLQQSVDRSIAAQNLVVEYAVKRTRGVNAAVKGQPDIGGTAAETITDSVRRGFDTVIAAQKEIVNLATKPLKAAAAQKEILKSGSK